MYFCFCGPVRTLFSDGYPSYTRVATNFGLNHYVVNHNETFVTEEGIHINNIEGLRAIMKSEKNSAWCQKK